MQERRDFLGAYHTYFAALSAFRTEHNRPFVQPVGSCIEQGTKEIIARFTFAKHWQDVTEDEWVQYFLQAKHTAFEDYVALDVAMQKLSIDTKLAEAESRVNRLQANMYKVLEDHTMVDVMFDREQKKLGKYLVASLEPISFKKEIQRRIEQEQNKRYTSNVIEFSRWLTELLASFMVREKSIVPQVDDTKSGPGKPSSSPATGNQQGQGAARSVAAGQSNAAAATNPRKPKRRWPGLMCKSTEHLVKNCPQAQPGEAKRLVEEFWASRKNKSAPPSEAPVQMKRLV